MTIEAIRTDGSDTTRVLSNVRLSQNFTGVLPFFWTPDNRLIHTLREDAPEQRSSNLWSVDIVPSKLELRGKPTRLTHLSGYNPRDIFVTAQGTRLSFVLEHFQEDVYVSELDVDGTSFSSTRRLTLDD